MVEPVAHDVSNANPQQGLHRHALREALQIEFALLSPVAGAITALPVIIVFAVGLASNTFSGAIAMTIGANLIAIASLVGAPRLSLRLAVADALLLGASVYVGTMSSSLTWLHIALLVPWCFGAGMLDAFGPTSATIGSQAVIAYVVLGRFVGSSLFAFHLSLFVVIGASAEITALVLLRFPPSLRYQRRRLSGALQALGLLATQDPRRAATNALSSLDEAQQVLDAPPLLGRTDVAELRAILDVARRTRLQLTTLSGLRVRLLDVNRGNEEKHVAQLMLPLAASLNALAQLLQHRTNDDWPIAVADFESAVALHSASTVSTENHDALVTQCTTILHSIARQVRMIGTLVVSSESMSRRTMWRPAKIEFTAFDFSHLLKSVRVVRTNLRSSSPTFRHAVRLAVAVPFAEVVGSLLSLPRSFWLAFAVAIILKPDYSSLLHRGVSRMVGTVIGASLAALVVGGLHPNHVITTLLIAVCAWIAYSTWLASFAVSFGFVTALVLVALSITSTDTLMTSLDRLLDFSLGGVIAGVAYVLWPTSPQTALNDTWQQFYESLAGYLEVVFDVMTSVSVSKEHVVEKSRSVRIAWVAAEEAVNRAIEEPSRTKIDAPKAQGQLVTSMRLLRALHALRVETDNGARVSRTVPLTTFEDDCLLALEACASANVSLVAPSNLREKFDRAMESFRENEASPTFALQLDELTSALEMALRMLNNGDRHPTTS